MNQYCLPLTSKLTRDAFRRQKDMFTAMGLTILYKWN